MRICVVALSDNEIRRLEAVLGITILDDPGFAAHDRRMQNSYELADAVSGVLSERDSEEWVRLLRSAGVAAMIPKAMSNDASFHRDPINQAIGRIAQVASSGGGASPCPGVGRRHGRGPARTRLQPREDR